MLQIELVPDIEHCIETVARRENAAVSKQLLAPGQRNEELEDKLEILKLFLETADFKKLRAESEKQLIEGKIVRFVVSLENGISKCQMHVT